MIKDTVETKKAILAVLCQQMVSRHRRSMEAIDRTRREAINAPGAMQSHSDTTKSQLGSLTTSLDGLVGETKQQIEVLKRFEFRESTILSVTIGSLVRIGVSPGEEELYFILPVGGGETIRTDHFEQEVTVITPQSPIGLELMGKLTGDHFEFRRRRLTVVEVM